MPNRTLNHNAFDQDTPESMYWLGFLLADGCISRNDIILSLSNKDRDHIGKFKLFMGASNKIGRTEPQVRIFRGRPFASAGQSRICITSLRAVAALRTAGVSVGERTILRRELVVSRDFWRGVVDGDGWVRVQKYKDQEHTKPILGLCGHLPIVQDFMEWCRAVDPTITAKPATNRSIWRCEFAARVAFVLLRELYGDSCVALDRKKTTADSIVSSWKSQLERGTVPKHGDDGRFIKVTPKCPLS